MSRPTGPRQLDIIDAIAAVTEKAAILELINADPKHARARDAIVEAIRAAIRPDGTVCSNHWRPHIPDWVNPRVVGATVAAPAARGVLIPTGEWDISNDRRGRNTGRPVRVYRWAGAPACAA
jgi:hypothetical protein